MALKKCPRCELNYILDGGELCSVCRREVRGEHIEEEPVEMCSECGENPAVPGSEYCAQCLKEMSRRAISADEEETLSVEDADLGIDNVSSMDEIVISDVGDEDSPFGEEAEYEEDEDEEAEENEEAVLDDEQEVSLDGLRDEEMDEDEDEDDDDLLDR